MSNNNTPPLFGKFGKAYNDLWKKDFETGHSLKVVTKTTFGLKLTTTGKIGKSDIQGIQKVEYNHADFKVEKELDTAHGKAWGTVTSKRGKLLPSTEIALSAGFDPQSRDSLIKGNGGAKFEINHVRDSYCLSGRLFGGQKTQKDKSLSQDFSGRLEADAAIGDNGLFVGASVKVPLMDPTATDDDLDINMALQVERENFTGALKTEKNSDVFKLSWFHKISKDLRFGAEIVFDEFGRLSKPGKPVNRRVLNVATQYQVNSDTQVKVRANDRGEVAAGIQQVLHDPRLKLNAAATFSAKGTSSFTADKFGLGLTFGDF